MAISVSLARGASYALVLMLAAGSLASSAAEPAKAAEASQGAAPAAGGTPAPEPVRPPGFACGDKALSGTGPGFDSSREHSEETARENWLEKAKAIYADAAWASAKDINMTCVKQGLYSKCFASAIPCGATKATAAQ